ncbi:MAG: T9SS type A sorting domain-containing protein [Flavobacteriales bacterium]|nr:T9SS type A sorting domain-containing protein [Flavobacteriales bacterium]
MGLLAWTASVRAQCSSKTVTLDMQIVNVAYDHSAYSNSVSVVGASYVAGQDGAANGALNFSNASHNATITAGPAFEMMNGEFTISAWIRPTSFGQYNTFLAKLNGSHRDFVFRVHDDGKLHFHFTNSSNGITGVTTPNSEISLNQWFHVAATWDGTDMKLYVDGEEKISQTLSEGPDFQAAGNVKVGTLVTNGSERLIGSIDLVHMRSVAMTADEIVCLQRAFDPVTNGIVLEMPLDGDGSDLSGNFNTGANVGAVASADRWSTPSASMTFSSGDRITVPHISAYDNLTGHFSISAWIYPTTVSGNHVVVGKTTSGDRDIVIRIDAGKLTAHFYDGTYHWCIPATATVVANEWCHVACTFDGTTMTVYQNGEVLQSVDFQNGPVFSSGAPFTIGSLTSSGQENFIGSIDNVKVWARSLSICEVRSDIQPYTNLLPDAPLVLCPGQTSLLTAPSGYCTYNWVTDGSGEESFLIEADNFTTGDHQIVVELYDYHDNLFADTVELTISLCTGITESQNQTIMKMYPNPASSNVTINGAGLAQIDLLDISGRLLESVPVLNNTQTDLNLTTMPSGVYFVRATAQDGTVESKRLIKH